MFLTLLSANLAVVNFLPIPILDGGHIGQIREIRSILRDQYPPPPTYTSRGLIIDMGIHVADEAIWLCGEFPNQVWARVFEARGYDSPIDEGGNTAHVGFTTPSGIIGRLDLSRTHASGYNNETYVIGTRGTLHVGRFCGYPGPIPVELWTKEGTLHGLSKTFQMTADLPADRAEFLGDLGLEETGLSRIIRAGYELLDLITFFTAGPKEARAWTVEKGAKAPQAAGVIHTDFERGFIRAETIAYEDFVRCGGEAGAKEAGKMRAEGKDYVVQDGDVMLFRFNV